MARPTSSGMIYVDASQAFRFVKTGKPVTGIQRLTLLSLVGLHAQLGAGQVMALVFDAARDGFKALSVTEFFTGAEGAPARFAGGDSILLMEWYWSQAAFEAGLLAGKAEGARQFRFLHDVIPVARPEFVRPENARRFRANTERAIAAADVILTNSDYSRGDILKHFPAAHDKPVRVVKLAHEFALVEKDGRITSLGPDSRIPASAIRPRIAALAGQSFALMVGTLEARKNTLLAVKAWRKLKMPPGAKKPELVLVGFYSAHSLPYTARLLWNIHTTRSIVHLSDCTDRELAWLYQNCKFTIYISQYEGWGLPVGESLWFGKPVITQRVTSLPEAGGEGATYVEAEDATALARVFAQGVAGQLSPSDRQNLQESSAFVSALHAAITAV